MSLRKEQAEESTKKRERENGITRAEVRKTASGARVSLLEPNEPNTHIQSKRHTEHKSNTFKHTPLSHTHTFHQPET